MENHKCDTTKSITRHQLFAFSHKKQENDAVNLALSAFLNAPC